MLELNIQQKSDGITIECRITPRSSKTGIKGIRNGVLNITLSSPPVDGKANEELLKFVSDFCGLPRSNISIIRGGHGRNKVLLIKDISIQVFLDKVRSAKS